ncbi:MAG: sulfatase-like hydrolase/transferase, partial [Muribaculaceae bacterium]|nr:sulfatase-like hydrolase/transferase [Muribaculaceae bacterium]
MKRALLKMASVYLIYVAFFVLQKLLFACVYSRLIGLTGISDIIDIIGHGLSMDCSMAAYLTVIPALLVIAGLWTRRKWPRIAATGYFMATSACLSVITVLDLVLYGYWDFRLDMTPLFYFTTSPVAAMASAEWWQLPAGVAAMGLIGWGLYKLFAITVMRIETDRSRRGVTTAVMALLTAALFVPIRGGFTVSTMNLSRAYFSSNQRFNHAAINPAFSLMYSATHQNDFASQYRFMSREEAAETLSALNATAMPDTTVCNGGDKPEFLKNRRPDIWLIILESFSAHLLESLGGENIAVNLDSLGREGIMFSNFYANSFRTDRALPAILSGFPSQPSTSIMKFVDKAGHLPSIAASLNSNGYRSSYYYGGDINFTNMKAYLVSSGFERIICDKDFSLKERASKWGAPDHLVFERALSDAAAGSDDDTPHFNVIQ